LKADIHDNELPKHSSSEERDNSTVEGVEGGSTRTYLREELINRRQNTTGRQKKKSVISRNSQK
jgi:hypothetical protein